SRTHTPLCSSTTRRHPDLNVLPEATSGATSIIENFAAGRFTSNGELLVTASSSLTLVSDTLSNFVSTQGGKIQIDGTANGSGAGATLTLQNTTIDSGRTPGTV